jgi:hypothetical protein
METLKQYNKTLLELDQLDTDTKDLLLEISIGKISSTILIGRLMKLVQGIKDKNLKKSLSTLGYLIYTVSLQSKSLTELNKKLDTIIKNQDKTDIEIQKMKRKLKI